ncbi:alpha/beta fold hydrolase [Cohnella cholangitidis]|uniref:Alpha/beta hydrolase n=1 Tax=Cohnella cholangitidis TaxID=2598458 RepID=A0A7G5BVR3_9BACL|nr:alpha/beta hydrolase [Cohnella cholangitidis]QMV41047.1 alpha/beta hydrolase [Cohnella cholangitidis]
MKKSQLISGTSIAYVEEGQGEPIVVLHGYCGSHRYWDEVRPLLAAHGRVIAPDLRGHGASSAGEGVYSMERLAEDLAGLLDELNLPQANLFGHSLGGYVALAFAEKYPERILTLGLVHSTSFPDAEQAKENRLKAVEAIRTGGINAFVEGLVPKLFTAEHRASRSEQLKRAIEIGYGTSAEGAIGCALGMRERPERIDVLKSLEVPILLLAGELDEVIPPDKRFPVTSGNVTAHTLKEVAHMGMMEEPQAFAEAIVNFLKRNRGTGRV